jgi:hypothetical protein
MYTSVYCRGVGDGVPNTTADWWKCGCCGRVVLMHWVWLYSGCGEQEESVWYDGLLTISATVSVKAQKNGGLSDQPIGSDKGMATSGMCG